MLRCGTCVVVGDRGEREGGEGECGVTKRNRRGALLGLPFRCGRRVVHNLETLHYSWTPFTLPGRIGRGTKQNAVD